MNDIFTTNWHNKMKTNPTANLILNNNRTTIRKNIFDYTELNKHRFDANTGEIDLFPFQQFKGADLYADTLSILLQTGQITTKEQLKEKILKSGDYMDVWSFTGKKYWDPESLHEYEVPDPEADMWANVYIDNYTHIHHPKLRPHLIDIITKQPLNIKEPSVFFST